MSFFLAIYPYKYRVLLFLVVSFTFFLIGCAAHPTVAHRTLKKGESYYGYSLSLENVFPVLYYRYGVSDQSDVGVRLGLPIYGSGLDYSRVLFEEGGKRDMINVGWSLTPNSSFDFTYYKFSQNKKRKSITTFWGLRGMVIPKGLNGGQSTRLGVLLGSYSGDKFGYEIGYFHDFASMPITEVFSSSFDYADTTQWGKRFLDYPPVSEGGLPTEYSRLTGLSVRVSFNLSARKEKKTLPPEP
ncbi:MAG: hypothetical protein ACE5EE_07225 [Fidelibacterota bacterium]